MDQKRKKAFNASGQNECFLRIVEKKQEIQQRLEIDNAFCETTIITMQIL